MANKGKVSISSDTLNTVANKLNSSASSLEGEVGGKLPGNFQGLSTLGLYSNGLTKIKEQVDYVVETTKNLASEVSSHLSEAEETEEELTRELDNSSGYSSSGGRNGGSNINSGDTTDGKTDKGKSIKSSELVDLLKKIDDSTVDRLVEFIDTKKDQDTLNHYIFNYDRSKALYKTILEALGYSVDELDSVTEAEYKEVQKTLIDELFTAETLPKKLETNSILTAREYLVLIANKNGISVGELLVEDKHENVLKEALKNLYDGAISAEDAVSGATVNNFRTFVDGVASDNNVSYTEVLNNTSMLL